jgi:EmrB/QacA subfamily drug resistance transporter
LALACTATFMVFLDVTIVNLAFTDLRQSFPAAQISSLSWVVTAYAVVLSALLTPAGRIADLAGRRLVFLVGAGLFTAGSAGCTAAQTLEVLVLARGIQGIGAAAMVPAALGLVLAVSAPENRPAAIALWGAAGSAAAAAGPALGGLVVEGGGWRLVFLVNLPVGLVILVLGPLILPAVARAEGRPPDVAGTLALVAGVGALVLGLTRGAEWGWSSSEVLVSLGAGAALAAYALARARIHPAPAVLVGLWRRRVFAAANLTIFLFGLAVYAWMLGCVLFLTSMWNYSALEAGLAVTPGAVTAGIGSALTGRLSGWRARRLGVILAAMVLSGVGLWLYTTLGQTPRFLELWLPAGLIVGAAMGVIFTGVATSAALSLPAERFAAGAAMEMTARELGGAFGVAGLAIILESNGFTETGLTGVFLFSAIAAAVAACAATRLVPAGPGVR